MYVQKGQPQPQLRETLIPIPILIPQQEMERKVAVLVDYLAGGVRGVVCIARRTSRFNIVPASACARVCTRV